MAVVDIELENQNNFFICCDTFIKLCLPSLLLNYTHSPKLNNKLTALMLAFILNKIDIKGGRGAKGGLSKKAIAEMKKQAEKKQRVPTTTSTMRTMVK